MPRIARWADLPPKVRQHLTDRMRDRAITLTTSISFAYGSRPNPQCPKGILTKRHVATGHAL
jgi:hypothetical protein